jgi:hypothetical protein
MGADWKLITGGISVEDTRVSIYMLVLKAALGVPIVTFPTLSEGKREPCFIIEQMRPFCSADYTYETDICCGIELKDIRFAKILGHLPRSETLKDDADTEMVRTNMHVSRKGSVLLRIIFRSFRLYGKHALWDEVSETNMILDCNDMLRVIRGLLGGLPLARAQH